MPAPTRLSISAPFVASAEHGLIARIDHDARILDGHYPEFGIVPGAVLVELAVEAARRALPEPYGEPAETTVESARFLAPVLPGDTVTFTVSLRDIGDDTASARVEARTQEGVTCCKARIRYAGAR